MLLGTHYHLRESSLDDFEAATDLNEGLNSAIDFRLRVGSRDLNPDASLALWHNWITEANDVDASSCKA